MGRQQELFKPRILPDRPAPDPMAPVRSDAWASWCYERALAGAAAGIAVEWNLGLAARLSEKWKKPA